ncbi:MAG: HD domain-containing phosphohydrolase [Gemmatimonadales bacterium]
MLSGTSETRRVLIVDDDAGVRAVHARYVRQLGYEAEQAADGFEALTKLALDIDLVLLDIHMPNLDGFEVAARIRAHPDHALLPIIMVTGMDREAWYPRALEIGANDVISKPINADELRLRTRWLLELKSAHDRLRSKNVHLEGSVDRAVTELRSALEGMSEAKRRLYDAHIDTIRRLTVAAEYKDEPTAGHIVRVGEAASVLAHALGHPPGWIEMIRHAAPMHDVGKIGIPDEILLKPGDLSPKERDIMRSHTRIGADILSGSDSEVIRMGATIALLHHERWDGRGYPQGLSGAAIAEEARICAIVDFYDASIMERPYRAARAREEVLAEMKMLSGTAFDPKLLDAFFRCLPEIERVRALD